MRWRAHRGSSSVVRWSDVVAWRCGEDRRAPGRRRRETASLFWRHGGGGTRREEVNSLGAMEEEVCGTMGEPMERGGE